MGLFVSGGVVTSVLLGDIVVGGGKLVGFTTWLTGVSTWDGGAVVSVASKEGVLTTGDLVEGYPLNNGALSGLSLGNLSSMRSVVGIKAFTTGVVSSRSSLFETRVGCRSPPGCRA